MVLFTVYTDNVKVVYKAAIWSKATFTVVGYGILMIVLPLLVALKSGGFWQKISWFEEQPDITWKKDLILLAYFKNNDYAAWSTFPALNALMETKIRIPTIKAWESDENGDGKKEKLNLKLRFDRNPHEHLCKFQLLLFFNYRLMDKVKLEMETIAYLQSDTPLSSNGVQIIGDLTTKQNEPLRHKGIDMRYSKAFINASSNVAAEFDFYKVLRESARRNLSTEFERSHYFWQSSGEQSGFSTVDAEIFYSSAVLMYRPGLWEIFKWAWVQYLCLFLALAWPLERLFRIIFSRQLVSTFVESPKVAKSL